MPSKNETFGSHPNSFLILVISAIVLRTSPFLKLFEKFTVAEEFDADSIASETSLTEIDFPAPRLYIFKPRLSLFKESFIASITSEM